MLVRWVVRVLDDSFFGGEGGEFFSTRLETCTFLGSPAELKRLAVGPISTRSRASSGQPEISRR